MSADPERRPLAGRRPIKRMPGTPSRITAFQPRRACPAIVEHPLPNVLPGPKKETTMIKRHSDLVLEITAYDAHLVEEVGQRET